MKKSVPILLLAFFFAWSGISGVWHYTPLNNTMADVGNLRLLLWGLYWKQFFVIPIYFAIAYGLWARKEWGRIIAVIYFGFVLASQGFATLTIFVSHFKGYFPRTLGFPVAIEFVTLTSLALIFFYLTHRQTRQYFQGSVTDGDKNTATISWIGYAGILLLFCTTFLPFFWAKTAHTVSGGKNQASSISALESRVYPSLATLEKQAASIPGVPNSELLRQMAKSAYAEGQYEKAKKFAEELLQMKTASGPDRLAIYGGNIILGRLALRAGNVEEAKNWLLEAGKEPSLPPAWTFSPNMALAQELLEKNELTVVLQYIQLCKGFYPRGESELDAWAAAVQKGEIPDFGAYLVY